jgi:hypothetical protein
MYLCRYLVVYSRLTTRSHPALQTDENRDRVKTIQFFPGKENLGTFFTTHSAVAVSSPQKKSEMFDSAPGFSGY